MKKNVKTILIYGLLLALIVGITFAFGNGDDKNKVWTYNEFQAAAYENKIDKIYVDTTDRFVYVLLEGSQIAEKDFPGKYDKRLQYGNVDQLNADIKEFGEAGITFDVDYGQNNGDLWFSLLTLILPIVLLGAGFFFIMRMSGQNNNKAFTFGKSRAQLQGDNGKKVTFNDVAGAKEEKEELVEIVDFLKNKEKYIALGARIPKGVLLVGPPGTGKTLLAKAVAGEAGVPFFTASGSDFVEMFVGVGASRVRDMFLEAKKNAPCIVFIDEIDAVGRQRGTGLGGGHDEREQTLNQMLVEMDGFNVNDGIVVLAATNRADVLDPALLRAGRFDRTIAVGMPDVKEREEIFKVHVRNKPIDVDVDATVVAQLTSGFTGADIENVINEAALLAARGNKKVINMEQLREAVVRVMMGPEKRSKVVSPKERKITAYHEAGHAVIAHVLPNCDPVHEVSIIPRGMAGGYTITASNDESMQYMTRSRLTDMVAELLGGRVSEEIFFGEISTGAYSDLQRASSIVRKMITEYGMNDEIGPVFLGSEHEIFIGRDFGAQHTYSEGLAARIDEQLKLTINAQYEVARSIIEEHRADMERLVEILLEKEKITGDEFRAIMDGTYGVTAEPAVEEAPAEEAEKTEE